MITIMKSKLSQYKYYNGKRWIGGTAAYNHFFKKNGGIDNVFEQVVKEATVLALNKILKPSYK